MPDYLTSVWRPVTSGRHAFPITATKAEDDEQVKAFCGAEVEAIELHDRSEVDWIRQDTCMTCWHELTTRL